jgi:hypothetical protein
MRAALAALACLYAMASVQAQNLSADDLNNRLIHSRAVEAIIWGMPAVNTDLMYQAMLGLGGRPNQGAGGQGEQLGADQPGWTIRGAVSLLWSREAGVRQDLGAARHRTDRCAMI